MKMSARNYFEIVSSLLFLFLGLVILSVPFRNRVFLGMGVGRPFVGYGIFRLRYIWRLFFQKGQKT